MDSAMQTTKLTVFLILASFTAVAAMDKPPSLVSPKKNNNLAMFKPTEDCGLCAFFLGSCIGAGTITIHCCTQCAHNTAFYTPSMPIDPTIIGSALCAGALFSLGYFFYTENHSPKEKKA